MDHLAVILHLGDDTIDNHQGLGTDEVTSYTADLHVCSEAVDAATLGGSHLSSELILDLGGDVGSRGEVEALGTGVAEDVVVVAIECAGCVALHDDITEFAALVESYAYLIISGDGNLHGGAVEGHLQTEGTIFLGEC